MFLIVSDSLDSVCVLTRPSLPTRIQPSVGIYAVNHRMVAFHHLLLLVRTQSPAALDVHLPS